MSKLLLRTLTALGVLLFAALLLRSVRPEAPRAALPLPIAAPKPVAPAPAPRELRKEPAPREWSPDRLRGFLEKLGRARLLKDRRSLAALHRELPEIFLGDTAWIVERLRDELFVAAGAAELATVYRLQAAVPVLAERLALPLAAYLQDVFIDSLSVIGGDAAAVALATISRTNADEGIRARAAAALGSFQGPEAYHGLVAALADPSPVVRSAAANALARLPSADAVTMILLAMSRERSSTVLAELAAAAWAASDENNRVNVLQAIRSSPGVLESLQRRGRAQGLERYAADWSPRFFEPGGRAIVPPDTRRIGITVESGPGIDQVGALIFSTAPFDRYRACFRFRRAEEFPSTRCYDADGRPAGDAPWDALDGTVFLRFRDPSSFAEGVLGYTKGCEAFVSGVSLLHELGHAFARLGDEYADGSSFDAPNTIRELPAPWRWMQGLEKPVRRDAAFWVPSENCHLSNRRTATRYCPVCQLEIHARMSELLGTPLPW